jgi:hypothetical protein
MCKISDTITLNGGHIDTLPQMLLMKYIHIQIWIKLDSVSTDKAECSYDFSVPSSNCISHCHCLAQQDFYYAVNYDSMNKIKSC